MQWQALFDLSADTAAGARCLYPQVPHQFVPCEALEAAEFCRGAEVLGRVPVQLTLLLLRSLGLPVCPLLALEERIKIPAGSQHRSLHPAPARLGGQSH